MRRLRKLNQFRLVPILPEPGNLIKRTMKVVLEAAIDVRMETSSLAGNLARLTYKDLERIRNA